jgi:cytochrome c oxidase subunit 3
MTISQNYLFNRNKFYSFFYLFITILLALAFSFIQYFEYYNATYTINDSIYGTNFFILTGFHGIHVIIGSSLLLISFIRLYFNQFQTQHQIGFIASGIY